VTPSEPEITVSGLEYAGAYVDLGPQEIRVSGLEYAGAYPLPTEEPAGDEITPTVTWHRPEM
jgi:hypothetical protein